MEAARRRERKRRGRGREGERRGREGDGRMLWEAVLGCCILSSFIFAMGVGALKDAGRCGAGV